MRVPSSILASVANACSTLRPLSLLNLPIAIAPVRFCLRCLAFFALPFRFDQFRPDLFAAVAAPPGGARVFPIVFAIDP